MTRDELEAMTKDDLIAYADDNDIEVHHSWRKDEVVAAILKHEKAAAKAETKTETKAETKPGRSTTMDNETQPRRTRAEQVTQMNVAVEEQRKLDQAELDRKLIMTQAAELEDKANAVSDEEIRTALLECVDKMRAKVEAERQEADADAAQTTAAA